MSRKDRTFTANDVIRLWCNNLDSKEQNWIFLFFFFIVPGILLTNRQIQVIFDLLEEIVPGRMAKIVIWLVKNNVRRLRKFLNERWADLIFNSPLREEVIKCIDKRLKGGLFPPSPPPDQPPPPILLPPPSEGLPPPGLPSPG